MNLRITILALIFLLGSPPVMAAKRSSAPPEIQEEIFSFLKQMGRNNFRCTKDPSIKRIEVTWSEDAEFDEDKNLIHGTAKEVWRVAHCRQRTEYTFTIGPDETGKMKLLGFEIPRRT